MATNVNRTNVQELNAIVSGAKKDVKNLSIMYFVNQLNKFYKKNEFVENTNIKELGIQVREYSKKLGIDYKEPFNAKLFTEINGASYYKVKRHKKASDAFAVDVDVIEYKEVTLSLSGLINAYRDILKPYAKEKDAKERENRKASTKLEKAIKALMKNGCTKEEATFIAERTVKTA